LSSKNSQTNGISAEIDKRSSGYKRRLEALESAPSVIPGMIERALKAGVQPNYVLMDTWFTQQPLIPSIVEIGLDVIGMVKDTKQRYMVNGRRLSLKELYSFATPVQGRKGTLRSIHTTKALI
jgi:hypothetical protein